MKRNGKVLSGKQVKSRPRADIAVDAVESAGQDDASPVATRLPDIGATEAVAFPQETAASGHTVQVDATNDLLITRMSQFTGAGLLASEEQLATVFHAAAVGVTLLTLDARFLQVNDAFCRIVGYSPEELLAALDCAALTYSADLPVMNEQVAALLAGRISSFVIEKRYRRKGGALIWVRDSVSLTRDAAGQPLHLVALCEDITERKRAERASAHLAALVTSAEDAIASKTLDGIVTSWNASAERMFGYTAEEMIGQSILRIVPADRHDEEDLILARIRAGQRIEHFETVRLTKDGRPIEVSLTISPVRDGAGTVLGASKIVRDITARKRADEELKTSEAALRASEEELAAELGDMRQLQRISGQLIREGDLDALYGQIVDAAMALMRSDMGSMQMFHPEQNALQLLVWRNFDPASAAFWEWVRVDSDSSCGAALRTSERVIVPDAETCGFMAGTEDLDFYRLSGIRAAQSTPLVARDGHVVGMISTHWRTPHQPSDRELRLLDMLARQAADLIERTRAEDALRASERALAKANQRKDEFLGIASHELRTPLTSAKANVQIVARRLARALEASAADSGAALAKLQPLQQLLEHSEGALDRLNRLVEDLLDDSRIQGGKLELRPRRVDLRTLVRAAVDEEMQGWPGREVRLDGLLTVTGAGGPPDGNAWVNVDPDRVREVVCNYLSNAFKYAPTDRPISVRLEVEQARGAAWVAVRDQGPGLTPEQQDRLFERFYRVEGITHQQGSALGLGLGLYICRTIIERHGGQVGVESAPGEGSTFWFTLPLAGAETADQGTDERAAGEDDAD